MITISSDNFSAENRPCQFNGDGNFMGNADADGQPSGFVRIINHGGHMYEGNYKNGHPNGFGRYISRLGITQIGWWKDGLLQGNCYALDSDGLANVEEF